MSEYVVPKPPGQPEKKPVKLPKAIVFIGYCLIQKTGVAKCRMKIKHKAPTEAFCFKIILHLAVTCLKYLKLIAFLWSLFTRVFLEIITTFSSIVITSVDLLVA